MIGSWALLTIGWEGMCGRELDSVAPNNVTNHKISWTSWLHVCAVGRKWRQVDHLFYSLCYKAQYWTHVHLIVLHKDFTSVFIVTRLSQFEFHVRIRQRGEVGKQRGFQQRNERFFSWSDEAMSVWRLKGEKLTARSVYLVPRLRSHMIIIWNAQTQQQTVKAVNSPSVTTLLVQCQLWSWQAIDRAMEDAGWILRCGGMNLLLTFRLTRWNWPQIRSKITKTKLWKQPEILWR